MPSTQSITPTQKDVFAVKQKNGKEYNACVLYEKEGNCYMHYLDLDKRCDEWVPKSNLRATGTKCRADVPLAADTDAGTGNVHKSGALLEGEDTSEMTDDEDKSLYDNRASQQRNFDYVIFANWAIKTWYFSPYPPVEEDQAKLDKEGSSRSTGFDRKQKSSKAAGKKPADIFSGRNVPKIATYCLWVCENCFKYMTDKDTWSVHRRECGVYKPLGGKRVYHRDSVSIWEVDGAKSQLYCQNLSLFGKFFIDTKTIWFDLDGFLFYIVTVEQKKDHHTVVGYFSKEKISVEDYNLNCIMTIPSYQRQGYGLLMIEFSYELSRRSGKIEGPERPISDLGLRCYLAYWAASIIRFFRRALSTTSPDINYPFQSVGHPSFKVTMDPAKIHDQPSPPTQAPQPLSTIEREREPQEDPRLAVCPASHYPSRSSPEGHNGIPNPAFAIHRQFDVSQDPETGVHYTHVSIRCTLEEIAQATLIDTRDVAFAMKEVGMLCRVVEEAWTTGWDQRFGCGESSDDTTSNEYLPPAQASVKNSGETSGQNQTAGTIDNFVRVDPDSGERKIRVLVITREMIEEIVTKRNVKKPILDDLQYVLL